MKKVLFATTALIATAGVAAADITLSGDARMGITHADSATSVDNETTFNSRARLIITMSGETDTGLSFGASFRADNAAATDQQRGSATTDAGTNGAVNGLGGSVFISGGFGKLTMGDIDSAHEAATGDVAGVGYAGNGFRNEMGYIGGGDDEGLSYSYSIDGLSVFASVGQPQAASASNESAFGASYTMNGFTIAAGRAEDGVRDQTSVAVRGTVAGVSFAAVMLDNDSLAPNEGEVGLSVSYTMDAITLTAFNREVDVRSGTDLSYTGIGASYNLGGGARLSAGYVDGGVNGIDLDTYDVGVTFSF
jgi:outer membrane protein OmpU